MMTIEAAREIVRDLSFPGYEFIVVRLGDADGHFYLQARFQAADANAPEHIEQQTTRKWLLSVHMTRSELVQTALKCVLTSVEHEAREQFTYRGRRVFGPHFSVDALAQAADDVEVRA